MYYIEIVLNKVKGACKVQYFKNHCQIYKHNTRKLWEIVNKSIGKISNKNCVIELLRSNNLTYTEPKDIANELCNHYSQVGAKMPSAIPNPTMDKLT